MKVKPGRERSLYGGVLALVVTLVGTYILLRVGDMGTLEKTLGGPTGMFAVIWLLFGLGTAGAAFYNAYFRRVMAPSEVEAQGAPPVYCPRCGRPVAAEDAYCGHCTARLN